MEDDRQYEYDGPDSEREPVHEEPAAMGEKPAGPLRRNRRWNRTGIR